MPEVNMAYLPKWERPIRVPEDVSVEHAEPAFAIAGEKGTWRLPFRLARGIDKGDVLGLIMLSMRLNRGAFRDPQTTDPEGDGYLTVRTEGGQNLLLKRILLKPGRPADRVHAFAIAVPETGLKAGSVVTATIGDRSAGGGRVEAPWESRRNKLFFLLRPEGGKPKSGKVSRMRRIVGACTMHIVGGKIDHLRAYAPSQTRPGEAFEILVRPEDGSSNLSYETVEDLDVLAGGQELETSIQPVEDSTCIRVRVTLPGEDVHRLVVRDRKTGKEVETNPTICKAKPAEWQVYYGMIHGHTEMSDGSGSIDHYFRQIRDEAGLDFGAPADHDHLDHLGEMSDSMWARTCNVVARWNEAGRFVAILGYEWGEWRMNGDGDRNVYYLEDYRPIYRSDESNYPTPPDLFRAIANEKAIVIPHHTGFTRNFCDWKDHDPVHERLVEIFQYRGSYECAAAHGNPVPERGREPPFEDGYVCRALAMGWRVGFTAGGDDHVGHAGTEFPIPWGKTKYKAGLMSVLAKELTREAVWDALWNRRVVATTGPRMLLNFTLDGRPIGSELDAAKDPYLADRRRLDLVFHGTGIVDRVDIIRNNKVVQSYDGKGGKDFEVTWEDATPLSEVLLPPAKFCDHVSGGQAAVSPHFCFYYVRVVQTDGEVAWASPVWIDATSGME